MYSKVLIVFFLLGLFLAGHAGKVGGLTDEKPVDENVLKITEAVRDQAKAQLTDENIVSFTPVSYATQVVAGVNYFIRVDIGADYNVVLRVFSGLDKSITLVSVKSHVPKDQPIPYF
eukprot:Phypoly_transcript_24777.p1 GENE.Phypoly_transcript_24777~~Phypoly_transcript_24777.p1  ORF type:complete len:117 (+),score=12.51 Phypoly_transcript_24777:47-397(+)